MDNKLEAALRADGGMYRRTNDKVKGALEIARVHLDIASKVESGNTSNWQTFTNWVIADGFNNRIAAFDVGEAIYAKTCTEDYNKLVQCEPIGMISCVNREVVEANLKTWGITEFSNTLKTCDTSILLPGVLIGVDSVEYCKLNTGDEMLYGWVRFIIADDKTISLTASVLLPIKDC